MLGIKGVRNFLLIDPDIRIEFIGLEDMLQTAWRLETTIGELVCSFMLSIS
jgi:hypothetical protein